MIGKISYIEENNVKLDLTVDLATIKDYVNFHVIFEDAKSKIVGEIQAIDKTTVSIALIGEIINNIFQPGVIRKPSYGAEGRIITKPEIDILLGHNGDVANTIYIGEMPLYNNYPINVKVNTFLNNHFAILGNTGSGKSYAVARIIQNIFYNRNRLPKKANIFIFDAYGEYHSAFSRIGEIDPSLKFKAYTTNLKFPESEVVKIPLWLLGADDIALLLGAEHHMQIPIIEKALRLVSIFSKEEQEVIMYKNDIIARALQEILYSGNPASQIRDQIFAILTTFNTPDLNLETKLSQPGYIRSLRQCLVLDKDGKIHEILLVTEFINSFIKEGLELKMPDGSFYYNLDHLRDALEFALISEGILKSDKVYDYTNVLKVRLHALINSDYKVYFDYPEYISRGQYIQQLLTTTLGEKAQIVNFNIDYVDDRFAKSLTKIYSKMLYDYASKMDDRAKFPIHIILEEAHRYVQNDNDINLLGYNIFDRITKEGRKYGVILGLITQRPSELSETAISQCSNFLIFKMVHPLDSEYIRNMVPNITNEIVERLKTMQPGYCISFGSAFKIPIVTHINLPNPTPSSNSADVNGAWYS